MSYSKVSDYNFQQSLGKEFSTTKRGGFVTPELTAFKVEELSEKEKEEAYKLPLVRMDDDGVADDIARLSRTKGVNFDYRAEKLKVLNAYYVNSLKTCEYCGKKITRGSNFTTHQKACAKKNAGRKK